MLKKTVEYKRFVWELSNDINIKKSNNNIIFLCIGTTKVVGDSFGPFVGTCLKKSLENYTDIKIMGDLKNDITYNEIENTIKLIEKEYKNSLVIVIDSALSKKENIGKVFVQNRGLQYAQSLKKKNNIIGNISIKAVVGKNTNNSLINFKTLKDVSMEKIELMSNFVVRGITEVMGAKLS